MTCVTCFSSPRLFWLFHHLHWVCSKDCLAWLCKGRTASLWGLQRDERQMEGENYWTSHDFYFCIILRGFPPRDSLVLYSWAHYKTHHEKVNHLMNVLAKTKTSWLDSSRDSLKYNASDSVGGSFRRISFVRQGSECALATDTIWFHRSFKVVLDPLGAGRVKSIRKGATEVRNSPEPFLWATLDFHFQPPVISTTTLVIARITFPHPLSAPTGSSQ